LLTVKRTSLFQPRKKFCKSGGRLSNLSKKFRAFFDVENDVKNDVENDVETTSKTT
jgi:hypothetical protein